MSDLISSTKISLKRIVPNAKDIFIKVERDHEKFLSKIHVDLPGKVLHAEKKAETVWEAIDHSYQAVLKQFKKIRSKQQAKRKFQKQKLHHSLYII
jgi:ribosome-associated translation inhibitor RaiA